MKKLLWKFFCKYFSLELMIERRKIENQVRQESIEKKRQFDLIELQDYIGKPVIYFSNEVQAPVIGFGERIEFITRAECPMLIVSDYMTYEETMVGTGVRHYTDQLFQAAFTIDPNTLIALLYRNYGGVEIDKKPIGRHFTLGQAMDLLQARGFFERLNAWKHGRELAIPDADQEVTNPL